MGPEVVRGRQAGHLELPRAGGDLRVLVDDLADHDGRPAERPEHEEEVKNLGSFSSAFPTRAGGRGNFSGYQPTDLMFVQLS